VSHGGRTFVIAPALTYGNAGRNSLTGPSSVTRDAMVARRLTLGTRRALMRRLEAFNALNRRNYQLPDSFVDHATFGRSLSAASPRQVQGAVRQAF
jgi:hypothetical protein